MELTWRVCKSCGNTKSGEESKSILRDMQSPVDPSLGDMPSAVHHGCCGTEAGPLQDSPGVPEVERLH